MGDTTNWAPRAAYVDFSLPYSESGIILVVKNRKPFHMWIFVKPLKWDLWLAIIVACILMGIVLCILEHRVNDPRAAHGALIPVCVLAFPESKTMFLIAYVCLNTKCIKLKNAYFMFAN